MNNSAHIIDQLGLILAIFNKQTSTFNLTSKRFSALIGNDYNDVMATFKRKHPSFSSQSLLDTQAGSTYSFNITLKELKARLNIEITVSCDESGDIYIYGKDVTEFKKMEYSLQSYSGIMESQSKILHNMAYTDVLTGIANRRAVFEKFNEHYDSKPESKGSVCILDIDHFKLLNDSFGHEFGDHVLKYFSNKVKSILDEDCFFARVGGEEFCVLSFSRSGTELHNLIISILDVVKDDDIITPDKNTVNISFSAGISEYSQDGLSLDEMLKNADKAMYYVKASGRSNVIAFSTDLFEKRDETLIPNFRNSDR